MSGLGLLILLGLAAFLFPQQLLCVDSGNVQADAIVVLGGGSYERPIRAAELFQAGVAPKIIVSGEGDAGTNKRILTSKAVPASAIEVEPNSTSTRENAMFTLALLRKASQAASQPSSVSASASNSVKSVIIVTTWYHSRRALKCFRHYAPDLQFYSRPAYYAFPRSQWSRQGISGYIRAEYLKLAGYWVCYGVCPL